MIPTSGLYRIPRADAEPRNAEALRFARNEYGSPSLSWMLRAQAGSPGRWIRFATSFTALFGRLRSAPARAVQPAPARTAVAAFPFAGEMTQPDGGVSRPHSHPLWDVRPAGGLLVTAFEADETPDVCDCHP